ncbi:MAG TPA: hypothetical protein VK846_07135 [Candidatus Limnocylindria bacterium]|nr:hypothetical protein [Candidatus Limnocylindria bacterium]
MSEPQPAYRGRVKYTGTDARACQGCKPDEFARLNLIHTLHLTVFRRKP